MTDPSLFEREVEEDYRRDQMERLWRSYGPWLIGGIVLALGLSVAWSFYEGWRADRLAQASASYEAAMIAAEEGPTPDTLTALRDLEEAAGPYGALARLRRAALLAEGANIQRALDVYGEIERDGGVDRAFRDLAFLKASYILAERQSPAEIRARVEPQIARGNLWSPFLKEILAQAHLAEGKRAAALTLYRDLAGPSGPVLPGSEEAQSPQGLKARATQMAKLLEARMRSAGDRIPGEPRPDQGLASELLPASMDDADDGTADDPGDVMDGDVMGGDAMDGDDMPVGDDMPMDSSDGDAEDGTSDAGAQEEDAGADDETGQGDEQE